MVLRSFCHGALPLLPRSIRERTHTPVAFDPRLRGSMEHMSNRPGLFDDAEVISTYSRAQALADGVLVDLRQGSPHGDVHDLEEVVQNAGIKYPLACTAEVWHECINLTDAAKRAGNDIKGRLWDILWMLKMAIRRAAPGTTRIAFQVSIVRDRVRPTLTDLVAVCGPGDNMEPVITIMFPGQD